MTSSRLPAKIGLIPTAHQALGATGSASANNQVTLPSSLCAERKVLPFQALVQGRGSTEPVLDSVDLRSVVASFCSPWLSYTIGSVSLKAAHST